LQNNRAERLLPGLKYKPIRTAGRQ